jgi:hypothetical protein
VVTIAQLLDPFHAQFECDIEDEIDLTELCATDDMVVAELDNSSSV